MDNENYWYNLKEDNGSISIEKVSKNQEIKDTNETIENKEDFSIETKKRNWKPVFIVLPILIIVPFIVLFLLSLSNNSVKNGEKYRTFMLYMVGSDLESSGSIATFDLDDIKGDNIDLKNNNVILMVGGSKKWHNFVNEDEIGIYELKSSGFKKVKSYSVSSMGSVSTLSNFLDYVHDNYASEKYDMIFWNHGLGAAGLEVDELSEDFLDINELDSVFKKSPFAKNKLELIIFNNCLAGNIHFASIMKNYAEYMVASEEVMYVGAVIDRLNFLEDVKTSDDGYDIGLLYVNKSDSSMNRLKYSSYGELDSTLSIIDLSKINNVETNMNVFFDSIDLDYDFRSISRSRRKIDTYGGEDLSYDTVDLYDLADSLRDYSNDLAIESLQNSIKDAVKYNSASNDYSNGISVYFPYYGSTEYIETHLYYFDKLWNNDYTNFINKFYSLSNSARRANRSGNENILYLSNEIKYENGTIKLNLTDKEKETYQAANIYIFKKDDNNRFNLILKSDQVELKNNDLLFSNYKFLKTTNNSVVSSIYERGTYKVYGKLNDSNVIIKIVNNEGHGVVGGVFVDSDDKPLGGYLNYNNELINYYSLNYNILNEDEIIEDWKSNKEKNGINNNDTQLDFVSEDLSNYYVLIEMNDENNDVFYSQLTKIK